MLSSKQAIQTRNVYKTLLGDDQREKQRNRIFDQYWTLSIYKLEMLSGIIWLNDTIIEFFQFTR